MHGALRYVAYTGMCCPWWNTDYFNSLVVSKIHSHKKLWVGLSKLFTINAHRYPSSIQFLYPTADCFGFSVTQFVEYGWNGIFCEPDWDYSWQTYLYNYMRNNTPFYTFNKDKIEHVTQLKQGHVECLHFCLSNMTSHSEVFWRFSIKAVACEMLANQVLKPQ